MKIRWSASEQASGSSGSRRFKIRRKALEYPKAFGSISVSSQPSSLESAKPEFEMSASVEVSVSGPEELFGDLGVSFDSSETSLI